MRDPPIWWVTHWFLLLNCCVTDQGYTACMGLACTERYYKYAQKKISFALFIFTSLIGRALVSRRDANVSLFARARNICCGRKICVRDAKNVSEFFQKHFASANKCFLVCAARKQNKSHSFARRGNITSNNVSATMFPRLRGS